MNTDINKMMNTCIIHNEDDSCGLSIKTLLIVILALWIIHRLFFCNCKNGLINLSYEEHPTVPEIPYRIKQTCPFSPEYMYMALVKPFKYLSGYQKRYTY